MVKHITTKATNRQADTNDTVGNRSIAGSNGPVPLGVSLLRSSYSDLKQRDITFRVDRIRKFVRELDSFLWLELRHKYEILEYKKYTKGTLKVLKKDVDWSYTPPDWIPNEEVYYIWSDYQLQVLDNMEEGTKKLHRDIYVVADRLKALLA